MPAEGRDPKGADYQRSGINVRTGSPGTDTGDKRARAGTALGSAVAAIRLLAWTTSHYSMRTWGRDHFGGPAGSGGRFLEKLRTLGEVANTLSFRRFMAR